MEEVTIFFDSYAVIELLKENPAYERFKECTVVITLFNLVEIYWHFLLTNAHLANRAYAIFRNSVVDIDDETLKAAMAFRMEHKKQDLSYADCIGYIYARRSGMRFLTGDKEFEYIEGVVFVK